MDETNVLVPDGFTQPIFKLQPSLVEKQFHDDRVGMKSGGGKESKGEITAPLKEYLDRFRGTKVYKVEKFVNRGGGGDVLNVAV